MCIYYILWLRICASCKKFNSIVLGEERRVSQLGNVGELIGVFDDTTYRLAITELAGT